MNDQIRLYIVSVVVDNQDNPIITTHYCRSRNEAIGEAVSEFTLSKGWVIRGLSVLPILSVDGNDEYSDFIGLTYDGTNRIHTISALRKRFFIDLRDAKKIVDDYIERIRGGMKSNE